MKSIESDNKIILEMNFKFQMKDYRLRFVTKRAWICALIIIALRIAVSFIGKAPF